MTKWRFNRFDDRSLTRRWNVVAEDIWPDIDKTVIYKELLDWGIDVRHLPVELTVGLEFSHEYVTAIRIPESTGRVGLIVDTTALSRAYTDDEARYVALVHELAHVRQLLTGEIDVGGIGAYGEKEWSARPHEQDAIRWSARQARLMGWSMARLKNLLSGRYQFRHSKEDVERIIAEGQVGAKIHPEQETLPVLYRRPAVRVRSYKRGPF